MRRPVKPFVTEYRGAARRQGPGGSAPKPDFSNIDLDQPAAEPRAEPRPALSARHAEAQEDSYEAAMRAADALFSARQPAPASADTETPGGSSADAPHAGGRVLRVLDEAPSPELLRLEVEHAPKRRGRKPGSKNKPKIVPVVTQAAIEAWSSEARSSEARSGETRSGETRSIQTWGDEDEVAPEFPAVAMPMATPMPRPMPTRIAAVGAARSAAVAVPRADDKYAWVRTKLKPGQQWKRRLPKVAW